jgi:hypothetical protein
MQPDDRPDVRARIRKSHEAALKRAGAIVPAGVVDAAVEVTALHMQGMRAVIASMIEIAREEMGELSSDDMERLRAIIMTFWTDKDGQPQIPDELGAR